MKKSELKAIIKEVKQELTEDKTTSFVIRMLNDYTGVRDSFIADFIKKHKLDPVKIETSFVKKGALIDTNVWYTAFVGNDGNKHQKMIINKFRK